MDKKRYITPATKVVPLKMDGLLSGQSMNVDSSKTVTEDNQVFARRGFWSDESDE